MLPFMKSKEEGPMDSGSSDVISREPDEGSFEMIDAVAQDFMEAVSKKDVGLLKSALQSLCDHIKDQDSVQDEKSLTNEEF